MGKDRHRPKLHVITIKKVRQSNTQISFTGHLTIDGLFAPLLVNKQTALFINNYEIANQFATLHLKNLRKDQDWFWEYHIEELPFPHTKHIQTAQLHKTYLLEQLPVKAEVKITNIEPEPIEIEVSAPRSPRKKRVIISQVFAIQVFDGEANAPFLGYMNLDFSVKSVHLSKSTAVFLDRSLAERFITLAQSREVCNPDHSLTIQMISNNIQKAKTLAQYALPAINRLLSSGDSWRVYDIEVTGASPKHLPDNLAPLKNFKSREEALYYLCTNLQITDQKYRRAYFDSEKIALLFLKHVRPFLKVAYRGCKFTVKEAELEPAQYQWVDDSMLRVKNALLTRVKPPKAPKAPRVTNKKPESPVLPDYYVIAIGDEDGRYFQRIDGEGDFASIITSGLDQARWYDTEAEAIEDAKQIAGSYPVTAWAVLMHREQEQSLAAIENDHQFKLWQWQQEQFGAIEISEEAHSD